MYKEKYKLWAEDPTSGELLNGGDIERAFAGISPNVRGITKKGLKEVGIYEPTFKYKTLDLKRKVEFKQRVTRETVLAEMIMNILHRSAQNIFRYNKTTNMLRDRSMRNRGLYKTIISQEVATVKVHEEDSPASPVSLFLSGSHFLKDNGMTDNIFNPFNKITNIFKNISSSNASDNKTTNFIQTKIRNDGITIANTTNSSEFISNDVVKKLYNKPILDLKSSQYLYVDPNLNNVEIRKLIKHEEAYSVNISENQIYFKYSPYSKTYMFYHISNDISIPDYKNSLQSGLYCFQIKGLSNIYSSMFVILNIRFDGITELIYYYGTMLRKPVEEK